MKLIIGLGNPGQKYQKNRHNVGFQFLDFITDNDFKDSSTFKGSLIINNKIIYLKPNTFMNSSGESVKAVVDFYKISLSDIVVIQDDLDLPFGKVAYKFDSGHGGHNGIRSITDKLGSSKYHRIKIGIGRPDSREHNSILNHVLSDFTKEEQDKLKEIFKGVDMNELS